MAKAVKAKKKSGYRGDTLADGTPLNVAVYRAYRHAGLSHNQAMAITAEVGRENGFRASILFGSHTDPAANKSGGSIKNVGMLSWNGGRGRNLTAYLTKHGQMGRGGMARTQANLNAQAMFSVQEMKSKAYRGRLQHFWANPNANPESFARELGRGYIVWAYGQNTIRAKGGGRVAFNWRSHDGRRRSYLNTLSGMLGGGSYAPIDQGQDIMAPAPPQRQFITGKALQKLLPEHLKNPVAPKPEMPQREFITGDRLQQLLPSHLRQAPPQVQPSQRQFISGDALQGLLPENFQR